MEHYMGNHNGFDMFEDSVSRTWRAIGTINNRKYVVRGFNSYEILRNIEQVIKNHYRLQDQWLNNQIDVWYDTKTDYMKGIDPFKEENGKLKEQIPIKPTKNKVVLLCQIG